MVACQKRIVELDIRAAAGPPNDDCIKPDRKLQGIGLWPALEILIQSV